jgi:hypothetical protein
MSEYWFEYHCHEGHDSSDAPAWYRSHERVTILRVVEPANDDHSGVFRARWNDGFEWDVWGDELMDSPADFYRPDPPTGN